MITGFKPLPCRRSALRIAVLVLSALLATALLTGCEPRALRSGLEAAFDGTYYRVQLRDRQLSIYDHQQQRVVLQVPAGRLLSAYRTRLEPREPGSSAAPVTETLASCSSAGIDRAEASGRFLLLSGTFSDPDCPRFTLRFHQERGLLRLSATTSDPEFNHLVLEFTAPARETLLGFGSQLSQLNFKGQEVPIWIQPRERDRRSRPLTLTGQHSPAASAPGSPLTVPYFISSAGYSWFLENSDYSRFDFRQPTRSRIHVHSHTLNAQFSSCASSLTCISRYTQYSGRMPGLPDWTQSGAIVGLQGDSEQVLQHYRQLRQHGTPVTGLWLSGRDAQPDSRYASDWQSLRDTLAADRVQLLGYFSPRLQETGEEDGGRNLYREARQQDYLLRCGENQLCPGGLVDLSNPQAFDWLQSAIRQQIIDFGFSGWLADLGAALPADARLSNGETGLNAHNRFVLRWARLHAELRNGLDNPAASVFFMQAGFTQSPALVPLFWLGEQSTRWDTGGLQSVVIGLLNSGISGQSLNHAGIGGHAPPAQTLSILEAWQPEAQMALYRSPQLLQRWVELSAFTPLFRSHEGQLPHLNSQIYDDPALGQHFAHNARLFAALAPYRQQLMQEASEYGWPLVRHPLLHYPEIDYFHQMRGADLQFMLGDNLMVAPVLAPLAERSSRNLFLPAGDWVDLANGRRLSIAAPGRLLRLTPALGQAPAFVRDTPSARRQILVPLQEAGLLSTELVSEPAVQGHPAFEGSQ